MSFNARNALPCRIVSRKEFTRDIFALTLKAEAADILFDFRPGQYAVLTLPDNGDHAPRPYSIASRPGQQQITFHIKDVGHGLSHELTHMPADTPVLIDMPYGEAVFQPAGRPIIAVGGGLGLAPLLPIIAEALDTDSAAEVHLYHGGYALSDLYMHKMLTGWADKYNNFHYNAVTENPEDAIESGLVGDVAAQNHLDLSGFDAYLSGAPGMVMATFSALRRKGLQPEHTYSDALSGKVKDFV